MSKKIVLFVSLCLCFGISKSQNKDSILSVLANDYGQEKIFIHFDKSVYKKGETIWFKAYLKEASQPSSISKNFYADWYNDSGRLIVHQTFPIIQATTNGQFVIDSSYKGKSLHIKAYTTWMLNFDTSFLYNKDIAVFQNFTPNSLTKQIKPTLNFFAEGGDLINGIGGFVAFKSTDQFQRPLFVKGVIKNSTGVVVCDSFKTEHDGMGMIYLENPLSAETYTAYWQDTITNTPQATVLSKVLENGVALQVQPNPKSVSVKISRTNAVTDDMKILHLYCFMNSNTVYEATIKMLNKNIQQLEIPTSQFETGVAQVTVFNANYLPLCERVLFINNGNYKFNSSINAVTKNLVKRGKNIIEIAVPDSVLSSMSISITDANAAIDSATIFSHMLLNADVKGNIVNADYYLQNDELAQQHLDLVMLTNGWRKYNWQKILNNQLPSIKYTKDTTYLNIIGNTYADLGNILPQQQLILFTETADSLRKQFILPVSKKGVFGKTNFIFYDRLKLTYSFLTNKKLNNDAEVVFSNGLFNKPSATISSSKFGTDIKFDYAYYEKQKKQQEELERILKNNKALEEVVVETRMKKAVDILDDKYTSNLFSGGDALQFDVMNDSRAQSSFNVFQYLTGMVAGLNINNNGGDVNVTWRGSQTSFFLDEMNIDAQTAGNISMNEVAYVKVFRPPFYGSSGGGAGGAIAIYTRKGNDAKSIPGRGLAFKYLDGYTAIKQFYSPDYDKETMATDLRETLYWNPYVITNHLKPKTTIEFFNNDITKKFRVVLCGMNAEGKMTWVDKIIE